MDLGPNQAAKTLAGKTALITGAARRLGLHLALSLAKQGVNIVVHYHNSASQAEQLRAQIEAMGLRSWAIKADLRDPDQAESLFSNALGLAGQIDILINNASCWPKDTIWDLAQGQLAECMQVHVLGPIILSRQMARQARDGQILNILDTRITDYDRQHASYHLAKRGMLTLTMMLAMELAPRIVVNAIAPGLILPPEGKGQDYLQALAHTNPMDRIGQPKDVVDAALFLLTSSFITGQVIYVDGGFHMRHQFYG